MDTESLITWGCCSAS